MQRERGTESAIAVHAEPPPSDHLRAVTACSICFARVRFTCCHAKSRPSASQNNDACAPLRWLRLYARCGGEKAQKIDMPAHAHPVHRPRRCRPIPPQHDVTRSSRCFVPQPDIAMARRQAWRCYTRCFFFWRRRHECLCVKQICACFFALRYPHAYDNFCAFTTESTARLSFTRCCFFIFATPR